MTGSPPEPKIESAPEANAAPAPSAPEPSITPPHAATLGQDAIDALLDGTPATPPTLEPVAEPSIVAAKSGPDEFERLVDSVESSLDATPAVANPEPNAASMPSPEAVAVPEEAQSADQPSPSNPETLATKSDEELLKEFENLLNS
jgi:hypothetical protein